MSKLTPPEEQDPSGKASRRAGIQSIGIGFQILDMLATLGRPSPLGAIAKACGAAPPQVHRYLVSLIDVGMAQQDSVSGHYDLGPAAINLGLSALSRTNAFREADGALSDFVARTDRTVQIAALGPLGPTIVRWYLGSPPVMTSFSVGTVLPLLHSATGRAFIGFSPKNELRLLLESELARAPDLGPADVEKIRGDVQRAGFAELSGTMVPGLRATAFPIRDIQGRPALTATMVANPAFDPLEDKSCLKDLLKVCEGVSYALGWRPPA